MNPTKFQLPHDFKTKEEPDYPVLVTIIESERGWGQKVVQELYFRTAKDGKFFEKEYNRMYNSEKVVPDWYMQANFVG